MSDDRPSGSRSDNRISFDGGIRTLVGFAVAFAVVTAVWVPLADAVSEGSAWLALAVEVGKFAAIGGAVWVLLRVDAVNPTELGFSRRHLTSGVVAFGVFWVALNVLGVGVATVFGNEWGVGFIWDLPESSPAVEQYGPLPATWLVVVLLNFLVVGVVEEVAFRGYLQSKVIALLGDDSRWHVVLGIGVTTLIFGALHTPGAVVAGKSAGGVLASALLPTATAVFFGVIYELTRNLPLVALLHGFGNTWPVLVNWAEWSGTALVVFWIAIGSVYVAVTLGYRHWASGTDVSPTVTRAEGSTVPTAD